MNKGIQYIILFISIGILGCGKSLGPEAYIKWMENPKNGLNKSKKFGPVEYTVQYKSGDYIMLKNNSKESVKISNTGIRYFGLSMEPVDGKSQLLYINLMDQNEYIARVQYFSFDFKRDISLNVNGKTFPCEYYLYENTGNVMPGLKFTLGFDIGAEQGDIQLNLNDRVFGNQSLNFLFKHKTITNIPKLRS